MVEIKKLYPGMRVKIVDQWNENTRENSNGRMDKYLGQIVTIKEVGFSYALIEEDDRGNGLHWHFNKWCFDHIVYEELPEIEPADDEAVQLLLFS